MPAIHRLAARDGSDGTTMLSVPNLLLALLTLVIFALALAGVLFILRKRRTTEDEVEARPSQHQRNSNHRRLTITTTPYKAKAEAVHVYDEKRNLIQNSTSPPDSPIPEIHITFPDEEDKSGRRTSGRVVVVRIGEAGSVGMEPVSPNRLPPYQSSDSDRFHSLDMDRMGGLKENTRSTKWS